MPVEPLRAAATAPPSAAATTATDKAAATAAAPTTGRVADARVQRWYDRSAEAAARVACHRRYNRAIVPGAASMWCSIRIRSSCSTDARRSSTAAANALSPTCGTTDGRWNAPTRREPTAERGTIPTRSTTTAAGRDSDHRSRCRDSARRAAAARAHTRPALPTAANPDQNGIAARHSEGERHGRARAA